MSIWDKPVDFWIGAGLVAEAPVLLVGWALPSDFCSAYLAYLIECPPSAWTVDVVCIVSYTVVAWAGHKLGLGAQINDTLF
jgi:hypothetical protein